MATVQVLKQVNWMPVGALPMTNKCVCVCVCVSPTDLFAAWRAGHMMTGLKSKLCVDDSSGKLALFCLSNFQCHEMTDEQRWRKYSEKWP